MPILEMFESPTSATSADVQGARSQTADVFEKAVAWKNSAAAAVAAAALAYQLQTPVYLTFADSPYDVTLADGIIFCDTSGGAITVNLPSLALAANVNRRLLIVSLDETNAVTVVAFAGQTIGSNWGGGGSTRTLTSAGAWLDLSKYSLGTDWTEIDDFRKVHPSRAAAKVFASQTFI
jgi:hypothetical protein